MGQRLVYFRSWMINVKLAGYLCQYLNTELLAIFDLDSQVLLLLVLFKARKGNQTERG